MFEAKGCVSNVAHVILAIAPLIGLFKKDDAKAFIHINIILKRRSNLTNIIYVMHHCMDYDQVKFEYLP